jgi:hypothetical protein
MQTAELSIFIHQYQTRSDEFTKNYELEKENERELMNVSGKANSRKSSSVAKEDKAIDHFMEYVKIFIRKAKVCQE